MNSPPKPNLESLSCLLHLAFFPGASSPALRLLPGAESCGRLGHDDIIEQHSASHTMLAECLRWVYGAGGQDKPRQMSVSRRTSGSSKFPVLCAFLSANRHTLSHSPFLPATSSSVLTSAPFLHSLHVLPFLLDLLLLLGVLHLLPELLGVPLLAFLLRRHDELLVVDELFLHLHRIVPHSLPRSEPPCRCCRTLDMWRSVLHISA